MISFAVVLAELEIGHNQIYKLMHKWFGVGSMVEIGSYIWEGAQVAYLVQKIFEYMEHNGSDNALYVSTETTTLENVSGGISVSPNLKHELISHLSLG